MCGVIDVWQQIHHTQIHSQFTPYHSLHKLYQNSSSFLDAPGNSLGPCLDFRVLYEDHLLYSHIEVEMEWNLCLLHVAH